MNDAQVKQKRHYTGPLMITWDEKFIVGIPEIDEAHFNLFIFINDLHSLTHRSYSDENSKQISRIFHNFLEYVYSHFSEEEAYMEKTNYAEINSHKKIHSKIKHVFEEYYKLFKKNELDMNNFLLFTKDWLIDHVIVEDQKLSRVELHNNIKNTG